MAREVVAETPSPGVARWPGRVDRTTARLRPAACLALPSEAPGGAAPHCDLTR